MAASSSRSKGIASSSSSEAAASSSEAAAASSSEAAASSSEAAAASSSKAAAAAAAASSSSSLVSAALLPSRQVKLEKDNELRIEVGSKSKLRLKLLEGTAEIFGQELNLYCWNIYPPRMKFAVFTWDGATIELKGITDREYITDETPMRSYHDFHNILEAKRTRAANNPDSITGPKVIVVGPEDSGKTSLCMMLLGWAAKLDRTPLFVDLDVDQGSITVPGCISAIPIEAPIDPVRGIPIDINNPPLVFFYGHTSPSVDVELYKFMLRKLDVAITDWIYKDESTKTKAKASGMIINTMGKIDGVESSVLLRYAISMFRASLVVVLDEEELYITLKDALKDTPAAVLKLQKSSGVVSRNPTIRSEARSFKVREYFYGTWGDDIPPHSHTANFSDFKVFQIGYWVLSNMEESAKVVSAVRETLRKNQHHNQIIAVSFAKEQPHILSSSITGFIYVEAVDAESETFTYLTPTEKDVSRRQFKFFSPIEEEIPKRRPTIFEPEILRRRLTYFGPVAEEIPNNCLISGSVRANLEESAPMKDSSDEEEEGEEEEYVSVIDV